ncbi:MAG: helicase-related protein [Chloroflexota bacterium]|nr:helicase-related protein [Chloroflexota bacterium]
MQLDTQELYSLIELLNPTLFPSYEHLEEHRKKVPGLSRLAERIDQYGFPLPDADPLETAQQVADWLDVDVATIHKRLYSSEEERKQVVSELADRHLLSEILIRNRKAVIGGFMPRRAARWEVQLTLEERAALKAVEDYIEYGYQLADQQKNAPIGFVMTTFQKLAASSIAALKKALGNRQANLRAKAVRMYEATELEDRLIDDEDASDVVSDVGKLADIEAELSHIDQALSVLETVTVDSKAEVLAEQLTKLFEDDPDEKVLIFTQFRETQRQLAELFEAKGWGVNVFHGQMNPIDKDSAVGRFRDNAGSQILISTEAGGEGRNFQFCHILVNHDLPWNPMRVEQRIGRVDRIGQDHAVSIFNLWTRNTIEERILDVLETRIKLFEETVGGLDPILGDTERDIRDLMRKAGQEREKALEVLGKKLEKQVQDARLAEQRLGDFILDTKSYSKELAERIAGQPSPVSEQAFEVFIKQLLFNFNTALKQTDDVYEVTFADDLADKYRNSWLPTGRNKRAVFRPLAQKDAEEVELMVFGHPIVDALVDDVLRPAFKGVTGTRSLHASDELPPCHGWLFTYQFTVHGIRPMEYVEPVFVHDDETIDLDMGGLLVKHAYEFDSTERDIDHSAIPDNLDGIAPIAKGYAESKRSELQHNAEFEATTRIATEVARIDKYFDYLEQAAQDKVEATHRTLERIRASGTATQLQILPAWEANLRRDTELLANVQPERKRQIDEIERLRYPQVTSSLKALGRIEVVARKHS